MFKNKINYFKNTFGKLYSKFLEGLVLISSGFFCLLFLPILFLKERDIYSLLVLGAAIGISLLSEKFDFVRKLCVKASTFLKIGGSLLVLFLYANLWQGWLPLFRHGFESAASRLETIISEANFYGFMLVVYILLVAAVTFLVVKLLLSYFGAHSLSSKKRNSLASWITVILILLGSLVYTRIFNMGTPTFIEKIEARLYPRVSWIFGISLLALHTNYLFQRGREWLQKN